MTLIRQLVSEINARPISDRDREVAALFLLDALASAYAGSATSVGKKFRKWAASNDRSARSKAFLLGSLTHITETDDLHRGSVTHPGCIVVPVVLALAEQRGASDREVLDAMIKGFEAVCRVGMSVGPAHYKIWHNTATCGPFGSAMAAACLLGLSEEQTVDALGNAGTQSSGLWQFLESGAMSKHLHAGRGSESGLLAAELAAFDVTGAADILEGKQGFYAGMCKDPDPSQLTIPATSSWQVHNASIKPWPSCRHTHPVIDASLELYQKLGNSIVRNVSIETYQAAIDICHRPTAINQYQAKFSLQHCAAFALTRGKVDLASFDEQARQDVASLSEKVDVACGEPYKSNYPLAWGASVTAFTEDNREISVQRTECKGDPELPLSPAEMVEKATGLLASSGLSPAQASAICDRVLSMPEGNNHTELYAEFDAHICKENPTPVVH